MTERSSDGYARQRAEMVKRQIAGRGIRDRRVLQAMGEVQRHLFVPPALRNRAYDDSPLGLEKGQTISQPYMVAWMSELIGLSGDETVLEVGTGSGYQAAVLARLARFVYSIERISSLAESARERLASLGIDNVEVITGDGSRGLPEHAPFGGIMVTAGAPAIPEALVEQLATGARLIVPVGSSGLQMLTIVEKDEKGRTRTSEIGSCVFVPLVGKYGWECEGPA